MPTVTPSNYVAIEQAVGNLIQANMGLPVEMGDFSKLVETTPCAVITSGAMRSPLMDRRPNYERFEYEICIHLFFDYTSDVEAHQLFREYRVALINLFMAHRRLDDGNTPYPAGLQGQCLDSQITNATEPSYFELDGKTYAACKYTLWTVEQLVVTYP